MERPKKVEGGAPSSTRDTYGPESIQVLDGLEAVRMRPGMYIGNVQDGSGLHHMLWEVVGNVIDEHLANRARRMSVDLRDGWLEVSDDGLGIPVEMHPLHARSALEIVLTVLHAGPTRWGHSPHVHVTQSMHGVGLAAVNALSERMEVEVHREGGVYRIAFARGCTVDPFAYVGATERSGTRIRFRPDPIIFGNSVLDPAAIEDRLRELAWLHPLLEVRWQGRELPGRGGLSAWVHTVVPSAQLVRSRRAIDDVGVDLAIAWGEDADPTIHSFVNCGRTRDGGTHVHGVWDGLCEALAPIAPSATPRDLRRALARGLVLAVHVTMYQPCWGAPTKDKLVSPEAREATRRAVREALAHAIAWSGAPLRKRLLARLGSTDTLNE